MGNFNFGCLHAVALMVGGAGLMLLGIIFSGSGGTFGPILLAPGLLLVVASLVSLLFLWIGRQDRKDALALQSADAIARWHVSQQEFERFRALDAARGGRLLSLKNRLKLPPTVPPEGISVVVGDKSLAVGDRLWRFKTWQFHELGDVSWYEGDPGFFELSSELQLAKGSTAQAVRVPVPVAARTEAAPAFAHLRAIAEPHRDEMHRKFGFHFYAARQPTDAPLRPVNRFAQLAVIAFLTTVFAIVWFRTHPSRPPPPPQIEVVACTPKETDRINNLFEPAFVGVEEQNTKSGPELVRDAKAVRASLSAPCAQFLDRLVAAANAGVKIPDLSGYAMQDPRTGVIAVPTRIECDVSSCVRPMGY